MHLKDEQIMDLLIEYVTDQRYKQAVLIDGDWGSGKTYFIQEKLLPALRSKFGEKAEPKRSVLYVSLYGMETFAQIMDDVYAVTLESFFIRSLAVEQAKKLVSALTLLPNLWLLE